MTRTEASWPGGGEAAPSTETSEAITLEIIEHGRNFLRSLVARRRCLSPRDDVERALERERSSLGRISTADRCDIYAQLLEYAFSQYHGDGWRHRTGPL